MARNTDMYKKNIENDSVIYIVVSMGRDSIGSRVRSILSLRDHYNTMVLVSRGNDFIDRDNIVVRSWPNITMIFKWLKLNVLKLYIDRYLYFPSPVILYVWRMTRRLEKKIENDVNNGKRVVVITSAPSHAICMAGLRIKKKFPVVKWVVDWRDLWSYDENYRQRIPKLYQKKLFDLEKDILNACDMNVTTNMYAKKILEKDYGIGSQRVQCINHAFDDNEYNYFEKLAGSSKQDFSDKHIKIGFSGTLVKPPRVPGAKLIEAIRDARKSGINAELFHYGSVPDCFEGKQDELAKDSVFFQGKLPYKESLRKLSECDFLALILADLPNCRVVMSMKITDYLLVNKPIIAIVPTPSLIADLVDETGSGYVISASSDWSDELIKLFNAIISGKQLPARNENKIKEYSWRHVSRQWISLINRI